MKKEDRQRLMARLVKLQAVAVSTSEHEAVVAGQLMARLMEENKITSDDLQGYKPSGFFEMPMGAAGFNATWRFSLVTAAARYQGCEAIGLQVGVRRKVRIVGEREAVERAAGLYEFMLRAIARLERYELDHVLCGRLPLGVSRLWADSFRRGAVVGIIEMMIMARPARFGREVEARRAEEVRGAEWAGWSPRGKMARATKDLSDQVARPEDQKLIKRPVKAPKSEDAAASSSAYADRIESRYAPRKVELKLEDASDQIAYMRGCYLAKSRIVLTDEGHRTPAKTSS